MEADLCERDRDVDPCRMNQGGIKICCVALYDLMNERLSLGIVNNTIYGLKSTDLHLNDTR